LKYIEKEDEEENSWSLNIKKMSKKIDGA